jgi:SAM-dependent methyltransferase
MLWPRRKKIVLPYSKLVRVYDYMMRHVDYKLWAKYIDKLLKKNGNSVVKLMDVACGTGNFLFELVGRGYELSGFDYTREMVALAQRKAAKRGFTIPFWCADMSHFAVKPSQDAIVCLYDSLNYLLTIENCQKFYQACFENLKSDGILIFDICTEWNSIANFQNYHDSAKTDSSSIVRKSYYNPENRIHANDFKLIYAGEPYVYYEYHRQKIFYIDEIIASIPPAQFEILSVFDGFTEREGTEDSERIHFVLRKRT